MAGGSDENSSGGQPPPPSRALVLIEPKNSAIEITREKRRELAEVIESPFKQVELVIAANRQTATDRLGIKAYLKALARAAKKDAENQSANASSVRLVSWTVAAAVIGSTIAAAATAPVAVPTLLVGGILIGGGAIGTVGEIASRKLGKFVAVDNNNAGIFEDISDQIRGVDEDDLPEQEARQ